MVSRAQRGEDQGTAAAGRCSPIVPFLRWAGSKRKLLPDLQAYWRESYERYVEPFAGSSCFFLAIQPEVALLADKNAELIEMYEQVRLHPGRVYDGVQDLDRSAKEYYRVRASRPRGALDRAIRFIYLNRNCFNGIYRTNKKGDFNVPFATSRAGQFPTRKEFFRAANALCCAELRPWDFGTTLRYVKSGDFVYLDPPYVVGSRRVFREYSEAPFSDRDLPRLRQHLRKLVDRGAHFLLSYAESSEARTLAKGWHVRRRLVRRNVAGFVGARRRSRELLISSEPPQE